MVLPAAAFERPGKVPDVDPRSGKERSMPRASVPLGFAVLLGGWVPMVPAADEPDPAKARLAPATFAHFQKVIRTDYEFRWRCLPWEIDPAAAARKAAREGKPILCFGGHDGVPLGFE
jgi:hypothetical protein